MKHGLHYSYGSRDMFLKNCLLLRLGLTIVQNCVLVLPLEDDTKDTHKLCRYQFREVNHLEFFWTVRSVNSCLSEAPSDTELVSRD